MRMIRILRESEGEGDYCFLASQHLSISASHLFVSHYLLFFFTFLFALLFLCFLIFALG